MGRVVSKSALLAHARAAAKYLTEPDQTVEARAKACLDLLSEIGGDARLSGFRRALHALPMDERHYWIGTLYTLMLPSKVRRSQATYFTPPVLADAVVDMAIAAGFDLASVAVTMRAFVRFCASCHERSTPAVLGAATAPPFAACLKHQ